MSAPLTPAPAPGTTLLPGALPWPLWCTELELGTPLPDRLQAPDRPDGRYRAVRVLLRLHGEALGYAAAVLDDAGTTDVAALLTGAPAGALDRAREHLDLEHPDLEHRDLQDTDHDALPVTHLAALTHLTGLTRLADLSELPGPGTQCPNRPATSGPTVTVAVCTRDRGEALRSCLAGLARLVYPRLEVLIVDNAPTDDTTRTVFDACVGTDPRFRYTVEPRPGLSWARNRALAEATGELLAYTDDDVEVDPLWVDGLVRGFTRAPRVGCVTGLVCTAAVEGPVEAYFDSRASWGDSCVPRVFSLVADANDRLFPYSPGVFGTGANVAFRTELMRSLGGFDVALGAGTIAAGGEDLDAFVRVVTSGHAIAYEPAALVWHHHRADLAGLERQMFAYGSGLSAFLVKHLLDRGTRGPLVRRLPVGLMRLARIPVSTAAGLPSDDGAVPVRPRTLLAREFAGMLAGPVLYLRSRRAAREIGAVPLAPAGATDVTDRAA